MIPRPRFRLALWAALLVVVAAFLTRSLVIRGGDFSLDLPGDAIALASLVIAGSLIAWARYRESREEDRDTDTPDDRI